MMSWEELIAACQKFEQTLEATIMGIPEKAYAPEVLKAISDFARFPESPVELIIRAIDSSFFEVITKNYDHVESLKGCFKDAGAKESTSYFAASVK